MYAGYGAMKTSGGETVPVRLRAWKKNSIALSALNPLVAHTYTTYIHSYTHTYSTYTHTYIHTYIHTLIT